MKQFSEAIELFGEVFEHKVDPDSPKMKKAQEKIENNLSRYMELIKEVQTHDKSQSLVIGVISSGFHPVEMLLICLSYGVCIGVEMERQELDVTS